MTPIFDFKQQTYAVVIALLLGLGSPAQAEIQTRAEYLMGTVFKIQLELESKTHAETEALFSEAFRLLREHDRALSDYDPDSELNRVQPAARTDWTPVSPLLCKALVEARYYGLLSEGAFDISVGPLVALWGFKDRQFRVPEDTEIANQLAQTGLNSYSVMQTQQDCQLRIWHPQTALDFGGIGKGLALDAAAVWLRAQGVTRAALDAGGSSMRFLGAPSQSPRGWPVLLRKGSQALWLKDISLASSGDDQQYFIHKQVRYGHILDPRSGRPVSQVRPVSVLGPTAALTDALSTALTVLPETKGQQLTNLLAARAIMP